MRSALTTTYKQLEEIKLAATKEVISDLPLIGIGIAQVTMPLAASINYMLDNDYGNAVGSLQELGHAVIPCLGAYFGLKVASKLGKDYKDMKEDYKTLLQTLANFRKNLDTKGPEKAERVLNLNLAEQNIKLTDVKTVSKDEFDKYGTTFLMDAQNFGYLKPASVTAQSALDASNSLSKIGHQYGKAIGDNLLKPLRLAAFVWTAFVDSVKDLGRPIKISKSVKNASVSMLKDFKESDERANVKRHREQSKKNIAKIEEHRQNPQIEAEFLKSKVKLVEIWKYKKILKNVDEISAKENPDKINFLLASGLMTVSAYGVGIGIQDIELGEHASKAFDYASDLLSGNVTSPQDAKVNTWAFVNLAANAWGFLGLGPLKQTADIVSHNHAALHDNLAVEAEKHKDWAECYEDLEEISKKQMKRKENEKAIYNMRLQMGHEMIDAPYEHKDSPRKAEPD